MFLVKLLVSSSSNRWWPSRLWLKRCGAFLMEFKICRTPEPRCGRSKLDELIADVDCCGEAVEATTLPPPLPPSKMVGMDAAAVVCPNPLLLLVNIFSSLDGWFALFDERRLRNDNDFKRLSLVDSRAFVDVGDCFWRSNNDDTNWSSAFKSAFIFEFRIVDGVTGVLLTVLLFGAIPRRCVICEWKLWMKFLYLPCDKRHTL